MRFVVVFAVAASCASPPSRVSPKATPRPAADGRLRWVPLDREFLVDHIQTDASVRCAVSRDGRVACWGALDREGKSPALRIGVSTPMRLAGIDDAIDVAVVSIYVCVAQRRGSGGCYVTSTLQPTAQKFPVAPVELVKHEGRMCARMRDGNVGCIEFDGTYHAVTDIARATQLSCAAGRCCAVMPAGVACFNDRVAKPLEENVPPASAIAVDRDGSCVRTNTGAAHCWGAAKALSQPSGVRALARTDRGLCLVRDDDTLRCTDARTPAATDIVQAEDRCRVHKSGAVSCYGENQFGELGDGHPTMATTPREVAGVKDAVDLRVAQTSACAIRRDGRLLCWGEGPLVDLGEAGGALVPGQLLAGCHIQGAAIRCHIPNGTSWDGESFAPKVTAIKAATAYRDDAVCVVDGAGKMMCNEGMAGAPGAKRWAPVAAPGAIEEVHALAAGFCARLADGRVSCFVDHRNDKDADFREKLPKGKLSVVPGIKDATQLATGEDEACAITKGEHVWCWKVDHPTPVEISQLRGATSIAANHQHSCAVVHGDVLCWGANYFGQLGNGSTSGVDERIATPARASTSFKAVRVGVGRDATCALADTGRIWCWGSNRRGELGQERPLRMDTPSPVVGFGPK